MVAVQLVVAIAVINGGYLFEGSCQALKDYRFQSCVLSGVCDNTSPARGNRFSDCALGYLPIPLPRNFVQGIDTQKADFERGQPSYLGGHWYEHGSPFFYLYAGLVKIPLGTIVLILLSIAITVSRCSTRCSTVSIRDELLLLLPSLAILLLVSCCTGVGHFRYTLPSFPFLFVFASKSMVVFGRKSKVLVKSTVSASSGYHIAADLGRRFVSSNGLIACIAVGALVSAISTLRTSLQIA